MAFSSKQRQVVKRCQQSVTWFLRNFGKLKHPSAGILPFNPFNYQRKAIRDFRKHRLNIFKKCRQSGVSTIAGGFATWYAMFHSNKTILIVSRKNEDAMSFLRNNIVFIYEHLPPWMRDAWTPTKQNEHEIVFPNGSRIQSLTSHPDVLRSHSSSLNIIDEAAFIQGMDVMWSAGWPTLQHGGAVICISTTNGVGNWYWSTWTDSEAGMNGWNPIIIDWWDMDWAIEFKDPLSLQWKRIAPRDSIRECQTKEEIEKYGRYWSPWLEEQYRALQEQGETWKFDQEILAQFVGSGNTVLPKNVISYVGLTVCEPEMVVKGYQTYVHPVNGTTEDLNFTFHDANEGLWVWKKPVVAVPEKRRGSIIVEASQPGHNYLMGVDIATGKGHDYSAIEVFDMDEMEQVAEFMARCLPRELIKYIDRIGRWYNCALAVVERNNGGDIVIDELRYQVMYPRIWRKRGINDKPRPQKARARQRPLAVSPYGFATSSASKPILNKFLIDYVRDNAEQGYMLYSKRLYKQLQTYVRKRDRMGRDTGRTEAEEGAGNYDDLVMASGLALIGINDIFNADAGNMMPMGASSDFKSQVGPQIMSDDGRLMSQEEFVEKGGASLLMPMTLAPVELPETSAQRQLDKYTLQLGGIPISQGRPLVTPPKYFYTKK